MNGSNTEPYERIGQVRFAILLEDSKLELVTRATMTCDELAGVVKLCFWIDITC